MNIDLAALIVSFGLLAISGAAAAAAVVQAQAATQAKTAAEDARNESRLARDEAVRLSAEANAAFLRQAAAQEEANELARAALPRDEPEWKVHQIGKDRWQATNTGRATALDAKIVKVAGWVHVDDDAPRDVGIGDSLFFNTMALGGESPRIEISWSLDDNGMEKKFANQITMP